MSGRERRTDVQALESRETMTQAIVRELRCGGYSRRVAHTDEAVVVATAHEVAPGPTCKILANAILQHGITGAMPRDVKGCGHAVLHVLPPDVRERTYVALCQLVNNA
jgi:hypothetical protein